MSHWAMKWTACNTLMKLYWIKQYIFLTLFDRPLHLHLRKWTYLLRKDSYAAFKYVFFPR